MKYPLAKRSDIFSNKLSGTKYSHLYLRYIAYRVDMQRIWTGLIIAVDAHFTTIRGNDGMNYRALTSELAMDTKFALASATDFVSVSFDVVEKDKAENVYLHKLK